MKEQERNKRLMILIQKLHSENDIDSLELLKTLVDNDTEAMKKSFEIMLKPNLISHITYTHFVMNKNRIIPNVPKEEREQIEIGHHNIPNWLLYTFGIIIVIVLCVGLTD